MRLKYEFATVELGDEINAVPLGEGAKVFHGILRLNRTAADIFDLLRRETDEDTVVRTLAEQYDASEEELRSAVRSLTEQLVAERLLEL